jgi:hypothetical protein
MSSIIFQWTYLTILSYAISLVPLHLLCQQFMWLATVADTHNMILWHLWEAHVCYVFTIFFWIIWWLFKTIAAERGSVTLRRICKYMSLCLVCLYMRWAVSTTMWRFMLWKSGLWHCIVMQEVGLASNKLSYLLTYFFIHSIQVHGAITSGYTLCSLLALAEQVI